MPDKKELIRKALMGDKQAQELCTAKGVALPCPCCNSDAELITETANFTGEPERDFCVVRCKSCFLKTGLYKTQRDVLHKWNTRPAPPLGRCGECAAYGVFKDNQCVNTGYYRTEQDFCSDFEPREEE